MWLFLYILVAALHHSTRTRGLLTQFDEVKVGSRRVIGATVCTNGIGRSRGLELFGRRLGTCLLEIAGRS